MGAKIGADRPGLLMSLVLSAFVGGLDRTKLSRFKNLFLRIQCIYFLNVVSVTSN